MNQRWPALFLALILLCGFGEAETTPTEPTPATKPRSSLGFSDFLEAEELAQDSAIRTYPLELEDALGIRFLGGDVLLFSGQETTRLTLLDRETLCVKTEVALPYSVEPDAPGTTVSETGVTYVDPVTRELVFLNAGLSEAKRFPLPEESGNVLLSADQKSLYYCTADALKVLDLDTGIHRLIRTMDYLHQDLLALHCDDAVVQCSVLCEDGEFHTLFISTQTGALLHETREDIPVWTHGDLYFAIHMDGPYRELLCGGTHFGPSVLVTAAEVLGVTPLWSRKSILLYSQTPEESAMLDSYHLETGKRTAHITLPAEYRIFDICPDSCSDLIWILCKHRLTGVITLCSWDPNSSDPLDPVNYLQPRWSQERPDPEGLTQCQQMADSISERHGVRIRIWTDAAESLPCLEAPQPEHQVPVIRKMLEELDGLLSHFPKEMLRDFANQSKSGQLNICLVRSIRNTAVLPVWDENADIWLVAASNQDLPQQIYPQLASVIDSRILCSSHTFDNWSRLNPSDFHYGMGLTDAALITGSKRCFVDITAMDSPHEDRKRMLVYAMTDGYDELFSSAPLQKKLRQLCSGIQEAFCLEDATVPYRWEQYLAEPLQ